MRAVEANGMLDTDLELWRTIVCHVDNTDQRALLEHLVASPEPLHTQRDLVARLPGDQLTLLQTLATLQQAGLVVRVRLAQGVYYHLAPFPRLRPLIHRLADYYYRRLRLPRNRPDRAGGPRALQSLGPAADFRDSRNLEVLP